MTSCVLCSNQIFRKLFSGESWNVEECIKCRLVRTDIFKKTDYKCYHRDEDYQKFEKQFRNIFLKRFQLIKGYIKSGRILDIGCSTGLLLDIFKRAGWEVWGVEPSKSSEVARKRGIKVVNEEIEKAILPPSYFDAIVLNHTLEHVKNPLLVLAKARELLKPDGLILVDVPNFGSLSARVMGASWPYLTPEEHLFHFTPETLSKVVNRAGFKILHTETRSGLWDYGDPAGEIIDAAASLNKRVAKDVLGFPGATITTKMNRGTSLTVIGKK